MNERIKKLADKVAEESKLYCADPINMDKESYQFFAQVFAESIIQECITQIALLGISNCENDDISWTVDVAIKNIEERFGMTKTCCNGNCNQGRNCPLRKS